MTSDDKKLILCLKTVGDDAGVWLVDASTSAGATARQGGAILGGRNLTPDYGLSEEILGVIGDLLRETSDEKRVTRNEEGAVSTPNYGVSGPLGSVGGIIFFKGPGSFTGLRIGASVANCLADQLGVPIVGKTGVDWISTGLDDLKTGLDERIILPEYGEEPKITVRN